MANRFQDELFARERLSYDPASGVYSGSRSGYTFTLRQLGYRQFALRFSVSRYGSPPDKAALKQFKKGCRPIRGFQLQGYGVSFSVVTRTGPERMAEDISAAIGAAVSFFSMNGCQSCCEACGRAVETSACVVGLNTRLLCEEDFTGASQAAITRAEEQAQKPENVIGGIVGAALGALIGGAVIVGLGQLGYLATWSGIIMGVCAVKGYELLGGKLTTKGIVISCILMAAMVYLAHRMDWAITIAKELSMGVGEAFRETEEVVRFFDLGSNYYGNLALTFLFTAVGAAPTIIAARKRYKAKGVSYKL